MVESQIVVLAVAGSSPVDHPILSFLCFQMFSAGWNLVCTPHPPELGPRKIEVPNQRNVDLTRTRINTTS